MSENPMPQIEELSDASLVAACLAGGQNDYARIVERYQRLLCSIAYSSLGSLSESEDVAQETFIEGWRKLSTLREPEKLRSWLCGILRFKVSHRLRKESKEPSRRADSLDEIEATESDDEPVESQAMRNEEQELLWTALSQVPENYREPLVLFYREHKSIEHVAGELDLTEDAVKQRLSRGRKMLQERMMSFVEDALARSTPGRVFTMGVLAALPTIAPPAKAIGIGAAAAHASSVAKTASLAAILASVSGLISSFFMVRANLDQSRTKRERKNVVKTTMTFLGGSIGFILVLVALMFTAFKFPAYAAHLAGASQAIILAFLIWFPLATFRLLKRNSQLRAEERIRHPEAFGENDRVGSKAREYKSKMTLLGIPLVHIQFSVKEKGEGAAVGWIAFGDKAYGVLFAFGGYAVGAISVGLVSFGVVTCSVVGVGLVGMGTIGVGFIALGAIAIGYNAFGSISALGWESAFGGGFTIARDAAIGPIAFAKEVNNETAGQIASLAEVQQYHVVVLCAMSVLVIVPVFYYAKAIRKRLGKKANSSS